MNIIAILCLLAGVQGLFLFFHFVSRQSGKPVLNRLVGIMLLVYSINLINTYTFLEGFWSAHHLLQPISNYLGWWIGPSLWFYVRYPSLPQNWYYASGIHYGPIIPIAVAGTLWPYTVPFLGILYYLQFSAYLGAAVYYILIGKTDRKLLSWIKPLIYAMALINLANIMALGLEFAELISISDSIRISFILLAAFPIFLIAYREMNASRTFMPEHTKYGESGVTKADIAPYLERIKRLVEQEKLFLNPNLKVADVATATRIPKRKISQVINHTQGKNFSAFINDYRLREAARKLSDSDYSHLSILGIAEECGFNSGGRFNTLFKKRFGLTPSQYRGKALKES